MAKYRPNKGMTRLLYATVSIILGGFFFIGYTSDYTPAIPNFSLTTTEEKDLFVRGPNPVSYDKRTPPGTGCEAIVTKSQQLLIEAFTPYFEGIRYVNMWGYLETGNKGDAAIWIAQQILLNTLGITSMEACRFIEGVREDAKCNMTKYTAPLEAHKPHSAIVMAGGGNFNDFYWLDHPQRMMLTNYYPDYPIRMFPQSIYMTQAHRIKETWEAFIKHPNLQLGARDQPSFDWLEKTFGPSEKNGPEGSKVMRTLTPDIVFMYGNRPDYRLKTEKKYDLYIMARYDKESSTLHEESPKETKGVLQLGRHKVTYYKKDWDDIPATGLTNAEKGKSQRAFLKADEGFKILGRSEFVVTDRLHGHIMSTIIGTPHVLMDSKLGKNLAYHDTWTINCNCVRVAEDWEQSLQYATMWFEKAFNEGRWKPSVEDH